jgi:hypothetical protein
MFIALWFVHHRAPEERHVSRHQKKVVDAKSARTKMSRGYRTHGAPPERGFEGTLIYKHCTPPE